MKMKLAAKNLNVNKQGTIPYACEQLWFVSKPLWDISNNPHIILQIVNKMIYIKNVLKFPANIVNSYQE